MNIPRVMIAGFSGSSGKTFVSLSLSRFFTNQGFKVKPYKKGPDYIDAAWLSLATNSPCNNLDLFFSNKLSLYSNFIKNSYGYTLSLIEGNRGVFDGLDENGSCSSAALSRLLKTPIVLVLNCSKVTRTIAAMALGCLKFEPETPFAGFILNSISSKRHESIITKSIKQVTNLPILGAIPRLANINIQEKSAGLEKPDAEGLKFLDSLSYKLNNYIDCQKILEISKKAPSLPYIPESNIFDYKDILSTNTQKNFSKEYKSKIFQIKSIYDTSKKQMPNFISHLGKQASITKERIKIGVVKDSCFWLYYPENLIALERLGAELIDIPLLPTSSAFLSYKYNNWDIIKEEIDALYIGGGTPINFLEELSSNLQAKEAILSLSKQGLPVYAEGAGLAYLCSKINYQKNSYNMCNIIPAEATFLKKPQSIGYAIIKNQGSFPSSDAIIKCHHFHHMHVSWANVISSSNFAFEVLKGKGTFIKNKNNFDGYFEDNILASGVQIYAPALSSWARWLVSLASNYNKHKPSSRIMVS